LAIVRPYRPGGTSLDVPVAAVSALVRDAGETPFIEAVLAFCRSAVAADFVAIFSRCSEGLPALVGTATTTGIDNARRAFEGYMQHYSCDVNFRLMSTGDGAFITYQTAADIESPSYRRACYDRTGIADRCSFVRAQGSPLSVSLYRRRGAQAFSDRERDRIVTMMPILVAAVDRHAAATAPVTIDDVQRMLARRFPALTQRESEVAARVRVGLSARRIAAELGIAETTVISHRKNAYARLGISGLRELLRL